MRFPFKRIEPEEPDEDFELDIEELMASVSERVSRFVLDAKLGDAEYIAETFGLHIPDDVVADEIEMSEERIARLRGLSMLFYNFSSLVAHGVSSVFEDHAIGTAEDKDEAIELLSGLRVLLEYAAYSGSRATVSQLEDMGLITYNWEVEA